MTHPSDIAGLSERLRRGHNNSGLSPLDCKIGLDELDALSVRVKELEAGWHDCITELTAEKKRALVAEARASRAEQERDEAQRDANRYQFLRGRDLDTIHNGGIFAGMTPKNIVLNEDDLDREIDAAIQEE